MLYLTGKQHGILQTGGNRLFVMCPLVEFVVMFFTLLRIGVGPHPGFILYKLFVNIK